MGNPFQLLLNCPIDLWMVVPMEVRPDGRVSVEIAASVRIPQDRPFAAGDQDRLRFQPVPHLRKRVPDIPTIEFSEPVHVELQPVAQVSCGFKAESALSTSATECEALTVKRRRAWPRATVG